MTDFTINGQTYRATKMDALKQFHVSRRLLPVLSSVAQVIKQGLTDPMEALPLVAEALSGMSEDNANYVLNACLDHCQRQQGAQFVKIRSGGGLMFEDIDMPTMMQISWKVLEDNLGNFLKDPS